MREIFALHGVLSVTGLDKNLNTLKKLDAQVYRNVQSLNKMGTAAVALGKSLTMYLTAPLVAVGGLGVKVGADFEKSMTTSLAIMGDVSDELKKKMSDTARTVAKESTVSASEAAKAYYYLASAGLDAAQSVAAMPKVTKFAMAGQFDMSRATDLLTDAQSALGMTIRNDVVKNMENMTRLSDVLVKANTLANASVEQFSEALTNKAGAALKALGKDAEEGVAVLAALADQGVKAAEGGTQFSIVLRDLQTKSIQNRAAFDKMKISVYDANGEMRNMADIIGDLEKALSGMSDEQKKSTLLMLGFSDKSINAMLALLGTSNAIRNYEKQLRDASGITEDVANKQMQNFSDKVKILWHNLQDLGITLFEYLTPALNAVADRISSAIKWFSDLDSFTKKLIIDFGVFVAAIGPILFISGKLLLAFKGLIVVITALKAAQAGLAIAFSTNPFGIAVIGAAALVAVLMKLNSIYKERERQKLESAKNEAITKELQEFIKLQREIESEITRNKKIGNVERVKELEDQLIATKKAAADFNKEMGLSPRANTVVPPPPPTGKTTTALTDDQEKALKREQEYQDELQEIQMEADEWVAKNQEERADSAKALREEVNGFFVDMENQNIEAQRQANEKILQEQIHHSENMVAIYMQLGADIGSAIAGGISKGGEGLKGALKGILNTFLSFLEKLALEAVFASIVKNIITVPFGALIKAAAEAVFITTAFESLKAGVSSFGEGAFIQGTDQGILANIGEKRHDEIIMPLDYGINRLSRAIVEELHSAKKDPVLQAAPGGNVTLQVGVLVADNRGLKQLERQLNGFRIQENQRRGYNA
jgi:TP901 family phage tail tape measure protein